MSDRRGSASLVEAGLLALVGVGVLLDARGYPAPLLEGVPGPAFFPGLVAATIFAAITSWNDFIYALVITGYNSATWPIFFTQYTGEVTIKWTQIAAGAVIVAVPVVLLATAMQKFVTRGLTLGAIK